MAAKITGTKLKAAEATKRRESERNRAKSERAQVLAVAELAEQTAAWWDAEGPHPMANRLRAFANHARQVAFLFGRLNPAPDPRIAQTFLACSIIGALKASGIRGVYRHAADVLGSVDAEALKMLARDHRPLVEHFAEACKSGECEKFLCIPPVEAARLFKALPRNSNVRLELYDGLEGLHAERASPAVQQACSGENFSAPRAPKKMKTMKALLQK